MAPLLCCFKLCTSFHSYQWILTGVTVRKRPLWVKIDGFFHPCDLAIWQMTLKNNRAPIQCYFMYCDSFRSHWWIQTGVTVRKRPIWVKMDNFLAVWPWNWMDDLDKQQGTSPKQHQALRIISSLHVNSNWSYGSETVMFGFDLCDVDLRPPLTLTFCMDPNLVIGNNS